MIRKLAITFSMAVFLLAVSFNTFARQPDVERYYWPNDIWAPFECDDFWIMNVSDLSLTEKSFYDGNGDLVKITSHYVVKNSVFFNSENPEISYEAGGDTGFSEVTFENGAPVEYRERGIFWHIKGPSGEKIVFVAGLGVYNYATDVFEQHGLVVYPVDEESHAKLCEYFSE